MQTRSLEFVVEQLARCREAGRKAMLVAGPGCSLTGGIPDAAGWGALVSERFPSAQSALDSPPTVAGCIAAVGPGYARELIDELVSRAVVNPAHAAIAELVRIGVVDRVLTTNADDLILRALVARGIFPAVYDASAAARLELREPVPSPAIVYLRGQRSGYDFLDDEDALKRHAERLAPLFSRGAGSRPWIVVGCGGESSGPLLPSLESVGVFEYHLFWAGDGDAPLDANVVARLGAARTRGVAVPGYTADSFLEALARRLGGESPAASSAPAPIPAKQPEQAISVSVTAPSPEPEPIARKKNGHAPSPTPVPVLATIDEPVLADPAPAHRVRSLLELVVRENVELAAALAAETAPSAPSRERERAPEPAPRSAPEPEAEEPEPRPEEPAAIAAAADPARVTALLERAVALAYAAREAGENGESGRLFDEAERLFGEVANAGADDGAAADALDRWGALLLERAKSAIDPAQRDSHFASAKEKCSLANAARRGQGAYNLACIAALRGRSGEARDWLEVGAATGVLPARQHLLADTDLDPVRNEPWFALIVERAAG